MRHFGLGPRVLFALFIVFLAVGIALGLWVAWILWPVQVSNIDVSDLKGTSQDDYIVLTASTYSYDQDLDAAKQRLARLNDARIAYRVGILAKTMAAASDPDAEFVAELAVALGNQDDELLQLAATETPIPTATATRTSTPTPFPTLTSTPTRLPTATMAPTRPATVRPRATATRTPVPVVIPPITWLPSTFPSGWPGGVKYDPVNVASIAPGKQYWHLSKAIFCDLNDKHDYCQDLPGGGQQEGIWVSLVGPGGGRTSASLLVTKPDGSAATEGDIGPQKAPDDICNCNYAFFANGWPIQVGGAPSDKISGLGMTQNYHVRFFLTFQLITR